VLVLKKLSFLCAQEAMGKLIAKPYTNRVVEMLIWENCGFLAISEIWVSHKCPNLVSHQIVG
jgi:hypothetical protein